METRGRVRNPIAWAWVAVAAVLALWTVGELVSAIEEAGSDAVYASRSPGALIVLAVLGILASTAALYAAVRVARGRASSPGARGRTALTALTVFLILLDALAGFASGPL